MQAKDRLADVKVGDTMAMGHVLLTVTKVTEKQIVCGNHRFRKDNGRNLGGSTPASIEPDSIAKAKAHQKKLAEQRRRVKEQEVRDAADEHLQLAKQLLNAVLLNGGDEQAVKERYTKRQLQTAVNALKE